MSMEKYGVEKEEKKSNGEKTASSKCPHPKDKILVVGDTRFCDACGKYLEMGE